jgi:hypothetical protein
MTGPQDRDAIERWIEHNADRGGDDVLASLQQLSDGEAWVWSPSWLKIMVRTRIALRETFDSSATPKAGENLTPPGRAANVDLAALRDKLAATIEKAKADDPRELKKQITELEKRIHKAAEPLLTEEQTKLLAELRDEVLGISRGGLPNANAEIARCVQLFERFVVGVGEQAARIEKLAGQIQGQFARANSPQRAQLAKSVGVEIQTKPEPSFLIGVDRVSPETDGDLPKGERAVLTAVAQNPDGAARDQISALTGYKRQTRDAYISRLAAKGLVDASYGGLVVATQAGTAALGPSFEPLPTGAALIEHWKARLPSGECRIFVALVNAWPNGMTRDALTKDTGFARQTRDAYISRLARRRIIEKPAHGMPVRASRAIMED